MAKQNVSFFERHMEKFIAGVCAAVLLVAFVVYTLDTPHGVKVGAETLGPSEFYGKFKAEVEAAREKMLRAQPADLPKPSIPQDMNQEAHALAVAKLPPRLAPAFLFPSPDVPQLAPGPVAGAIDLARILPPLRPTLTTGRSTAVLPQPVVVTPDSDAKASSLGEAKDQVAAQDCFWITVVSALNRKQQRDAFEAAKYNATRMALIVGAVDVERQELLPGGGWSAPQAVQPYMPWSVKPLADLKMEEQDGMMNIPEAEAAALRKYREKVEDYNTQQQEILRPHFVNYLKSHGWDWKVPHKVEGMSVDMTAFGVEFPAEVTKKKGERPAAPVRPQNQATDGAKGKKPNAAAPKPKQGGVEAGPAGAAKEAESAALKQAVALKKEADDLLKAREKAADAAAKDKLLLQARDKLAEIVKLAGPNPESQKDEKLAVQIKKAQEQFDQLQDEAQRIEEQQLSESKQRAQKWAMNFGPDVDPMWVNDTTVTPGKTYRYRLRVKAVNNYAAVPGYLKNSQDICKVLLDGEWSEWSDAIAVPPAKELFVTAVEDDGSAKVELNEWTAGDWKQAKNEGKATVGQAMTCGTGKNKISYDGILMNVDLRRTMRIRSEDRNGVVSYKDGTDPKEMRSITLVNSRGEAEEHVVAEDANARRRFARDKADAERFYREHPTPPKLSRLEIIPAAAAAAAATGEQPAGGAAPVPPAAGQ